MKLKNLATGEIEFMRYDPAVAAVEAGTHEHVNDEPETVDEASPEPGLAKVEPVRSAPKTETKPEPKKPEAKG